MQDILSRVVPKFVSQKTKQDHFFLLAFFGLSFRFFLFFCCGWFEVVRPVCGLFCLRKFLVRFHSFPIFAWLKSKN